MDLRGTQDPQVDYKRFERSVNYMLAKATHSNNKVVRFLLSTDAGSRVTLPDSKAKLSSKVSKQTLRDNGQRSLPDALLQGELKSGETLQIVCDAKFYTSDLSEKTISKTVDDMKLRGTNLGLLVCSQDTKLHTYD